MQFAFIKDAHSLERLILVAQIFVVNEGKAYRHTVKCRANLQKYLDLIHAAIVSWLMIHLVWMHYIVLHICHNFQITLPQSLETAVEVEASKLSSWDLLLQFAFEFARLLFLFVDFFVGNL